MGARDPTLRFSDRAEDYHRYRPRYPPEVVEVLRGRIGLDDDWTVADIGSGTGISSELFLDQGLEVFAVEPNHDMRVAAEKRLGRHPRFHSVAGTAERTGLEPESVQLVVAAQAFHWFDPGGAREEARRILRAPEWAALVWNTRLTDATPFLQAYEALLVKHGTDYHAVRHDRREAGPLRTFFPGGFQRITLPNEQLLDFAGLRGRLASSSYVPAPGTAGHGRMLEDLGSLFAAHERDGVVALTYDCEVLLGKVVSGT
jgi:SAM-dependent methyltransferase